MILISKSELFDHLKYMSEIKTDQLKEVIDRLPIVEVVWCKDCKHYKPFDKSKKFDCPQGLYAVFENDYCSHGERNEE